MRPRARFTVLLAWLALAALPAHAGGGVMMQYFHWYLPADGSLWSQVAEEADELAEAGFTALWLPPASARSSDDVGYGVYDLYDLGEFERQEGDPRRTKYGTREEYLAAIDAAQAEGIQIYADVVLNHKAGADDTERVLAVRVAKNNRNYEFGGEIEIDAWTRFDFPGRGDTHSDFKWRWFHFDGVDWADDLEEGSIFKFRGQGKAWDWQVDTENANYDYLMFADIDLDHPEVVAELERWGKWYLDETGVDGFRLDAVKHIRYGFYPEWLDHLRTETGRELFAVGEYWSYDIGKLRDYLAATRGTHSLFDAPLHINFHHASSSGGGYDMRRLLDNTLMKERPELAVTLVDNHDTQPCQALVSPVQDWFKPLAYAVILLRAEGYPNVFYADYYGAEYSDKDCGPIRLASHREQIDRLLDARRRYAWGPQLDYFDHPDIIGWTRHGDAEHPEALAVLVTDGPGGSKWMDTGRPGVEFRDLTGGFAEPVRTNDHGWGEFPVAGGSMSVWVGESPERAPGEVTFICHDGHTYWGQNVYVVGDLAELGAWDPASAVKLSPDAYPTWRGAVAVPEGRAFEWKCIKKDGDEVVWQQDPNNSYPGSGVTASGSF